VLAARGVPLPAAQRKIRLSAAPSGSGAGGGGGDCHGDSGAEGGGQAGEGAGGEAAGALVHLDLPRWFGGSEAVPWLRTLATAVRNRRAVRIGYRRGDRHGDRGAESSRVIRPLGLVNKAGTRASAEALAVFPEVFGDAVRPALDAAPPADERGYLDVALTFEHEAAAVQRLAGFGGWVEVLLPRPCGRG
jgi:hypothetical protein